MPINIEKYQEVILYLCQQLGGDIKGKKKLAKLLYFADFDFFEKTGESITGDTYYALPMGPFPTRLAEVTGEMKKSQEITIEKVQEFGSQYEATDVYHCVNPSYRTQYLTADEKSMLDRVIKKYGQLNGKQLEDLSHQEAPYIATEPQKEISYELAYYRGTEFV